jgi:hypothetical protein
LTPLGENPEDAKSMWMLEGPTLPQTIPNGGTLEIGRSPLGDAECRRMFTATTAIRRTVHEPSAPLPTEFFILLFLKILE